jgi:hypothetical protein
MRKSTTVTTDDPQNSKFKITVTGSVEKIVTIDPTSVYLEGEPGTTLETIIKITPSQKYKFSILRLEQKVNKNIQAELIAPKKDEKAWHIKVKALSEKTGQLYDMLTLKTDSQYRSSFSIRVYAKFVEKLQTDS